MVHVGKGDRNKPYQSCKSATLRSSVSACHMLAFSSSRYAFSQLDCHSAVHLTLDHRYVYGWRVPRRDIPCRRPHRCGAVQLNLLQSSGTCITYCATNITTHAFSGPTYIFSQTENGSYVRSCGTVVRGRICPDTARLTPVLICSHNTAMWVDSWGSWHFSI